MAHHGMHQIGEAAGRTGLSLRTVRYYEEVALVVPSGRTEGGFRLYTDDDIDRLTLVKQLKPLDFTLEELRELLETRDRLRDADLADADRPALAETLVGYTQAVRQRCEQLRDQLAQVEAVTATLSREARAARRAARGSRLP